MRIFYLLLYIVFFVSIITSCKKPNDNKPEPLGGYTFPFPNIPYDTTTISGAFIVGVVNPNWYTFAKFYIFPTTSLRNYEDAYLNGAELSASDFTPGSGYFYMDSYSAVNTFNDTVANWQITDSRTFSFTDTDIQPAIVVHLPDTIEYSVGVTLYIDSVSNADTIQANCAIVRGKSLNKSVTVGTDSIRIDSTIIDALPGNYITLTVSAIRHQYQTFNGYSYLFIKECDVEKSVWIK